MQMQDFLLALTSNIAYVAFWMAIVTSVISVACLIGLFGTNREFEEIEFLGLVKTFLPLSMIFWALSAMPGVKDVKNVQESFATPHPAKHAKKEVRK
jgi:hypothetical protein